MKQQSSHHAQAKTSTRTCWASWIILHRGLALSLFLLSFLLCFTSLSSHLTQPISPPWNLSTSMHCNLHFARNLEYILCTSLIWQIILLCLLHSFLYWDFDAPTWIFKLCQRRNNILKYFVALFSYARTISWAHSMF